MNRYPPAEPIIIPKERVLIDAISLDEEIQLERELLEEEMRPIEAAWAEHYPRMNYQAPSPMAIWWPQGNQKLTALQLAFIQHVNFQGEIENGRRLEFRTAYQILREKAKGESTQFMTEAADLIWQLRAVA